MLTVKSVPDTISFYSSVLGMEVVTFKVCTVKPIAFIINAVGHVSIKYACLL